MLYCCLCYCCMCEHRHQSVIYKHIATANSIHIYDINFAALLHMIFPSDACLTVHGSSPSSFLARTIQHVACSTITPHIYIQTVHHISSRKNHPIFITLIYSSTHTQHDRTSSLTTTAVTYCGPPPKTEAHQYLICRFDSLLSAVKLTTTTYTDVGHARPPFSAPSPLNLGMPP